MQALRIEETLLFGNPVAQIYECVKQKQAGFVNISTTKSLSLSSSLSVQEVSAL